MNITATQLNKHTGNYLHSAAKEPIIIEKTGHPVAVILSYEKYKELEQLEDMYWGERAKKIEKDSKWLSKKETAKFLQQCIEEEEKDKKD